MPSHLGKFSYGFAALLLAAAISIAYLTLPIFRAPLFIVENTTDKPVYVTALWLKDKRDLGELAPKGTVEFTVEDEAAMSFAVTYAGGNIITSDEIYFTSGTVVVVEITDAVVTVDYDFGD